ncbi:PEP-CTERM sorting domain-containing protein [Janthinobacterium sp. GB4P2]|uniref:PEP-CTERM sorting domain-containing protein n=1 Tax=Janthinobacterium sp. GB4P2 TaxID=3424189 RepID=UPI003F205670
MNLMKKQLCFFALMLAASSMHGAHAQETMDPLQTKNFLLTEYPEYYGNTHSQQLTLLSDTNGVTKIGLTGLATSLLMDNYGQSLSNGNQHTGMFDVSVRDGYRVTGFSFAATLVGVTLASEAPFGSVTQFPGLASNNGWFGANARTSPNGHSLAGESMQLENLNGTQQVLLQGKGLSLSDHFTMAVFGASSISATGGLYYMSGHDWGQSIGLPSYASFRVDNPTLTIFTSPVPEPGTYAMLLAGLTLCGAASLRRRHGARSSELS